MADITLTAAVRSNLGTLQNTANLISQTQERLSTGNKVNSALDNPNSFFTASSLNARASDLSNLQDDIGQSVSTLQAADKGITAIDKLLDAAKGKANQALQSKDNDTRAKYAAEFNDLRTQIEDIAKDSGYKGKNLLGGKGNDLTVKFNEDGSSKLDINSVDYTDLDSDKAAFKLGKIGDTVAEVEKSDGKAEFTLGRSLPSEVQVGESEALVLASDGSAAAGGTTITDLAGFDNGDKITFTDAQGNTEELTLVGGDDITATVGKLTTEFQKISGNDTATVTFEDGKFKFTGGAESVRVSHDGGAFTDFTLEGTKQANTKLASLDAFSAGDTIKFQLGDGAETSFTIGANSSVQDLANAIDSVGNVSASVSDDGKLVIDNRTVDDVLTADTDEGQKFKLSFVGNGSGAEFTDSTKNVVDQDFNEVEGRGWGSDKLIEDSLDEIREAQLSLRAQASTFGTNLSVVKNRQNFTKDLINTLQTGAGKLTLADTNLEGANLAALNTQNQIANTTLGLAARANQSVLQLIR